MAGKPYGIREMKVIVDYLVEHKAFGEIRGRKRWMDLANSQMTTRTWQSLKETFLKRILPDIHNPYYKLTVMQISSFKQEHDVAALQNSNKLEIRTASEDSNNVEDNQEQHETTSTNKENQEDSAPGEIPSKIPSHSRSSVETLVLDQEEDPHDDQKSMRDRIVYTEPLTPMIQQVIDDFNTDDEQLEIDENPPINNTETEPEAPKTISNEGIARVQPMKEVNNDIQEKAQENDEPTPKVNGNIENSSKIETGQSQTQKTNNSTDSTIPNNQEVLIQNEVTEKEIVNVNFTETQQNEENNNVDTRSRKRTASVTYNITKKTAAKSPTPDKQENLCLKSVSLFAEQFSPPNFVDSDSSLDNADQGPEKKQDTEVPKIIVDRTKDVVLLGSHSDSDLEPVQNAKITKMVNKTQTLTKTRTKAMANVFGFSTGGVHDKHSGIGKKATHHRKMQDVVMSDSEWTSDGDEDFVSPPRARKNRASKKYIRPRSARILSLEEEGGLFVVHGRKIYPLVKDGKMIKNYVNYFEEFDADDDEEESYWKLKYAQEKLKTAELSKLLEKKSAIPTKPQEIKSRRQSTIKLKLDRQSTIKLKLDTEKSETESENSIVKTKETVATNEGNIKIKFTGHHKEVQLEGHWSQINPVLQQVVNIFQNDADNKEIKDKEREKKKSTTQNLNTNSKTEEKEGATLIEEVSEENTKQKRDVTELEASIFKEIEEKDKEEKVPTRLRERNKKNVNVEPSPAKIPKLDEKKTDVSTINTAPKRKDSETTRKHPQTRKSLKEENEILYKFPSPPPSALESRLSTKRKSKLPNLRHKEKMNESPENHSLHSESTQGYQDSDISPIARRVRRRRKHSFSSLKNLPSTHRVKRFTRRRSHPDLKIDVSSDSSNSSFNFLHKTTVFKNSSLNSDIFNSESYQLLMPKARPLKLLESIDETKPVSRERYPTLSEDQDNSDALSVKSHDTIIISIHNDERNSSNVSLPVSPELSIVEKLSVNKSLLSSDIDFPTLNELQSNETEPSTNNNYMLSVVDASVPLMQQDCSFFKQNNFGNNNERAKTKPSTDSLQKSPKKSQETNSPTKTLHAKLRDLILNSAKKIVDMSVDTSQKVEPMEVDCSKAEPKKVRKKRSSTPQKKTKPRAAKRTSNAPVIVERVECCSNGGRHSCPPSVLAPIVNISQNPNPTKDISDTQKTKGSRRKKDIIKVKILRPKSRTPDKSKPQPSEDETSKGSTETSHGTNESGIFLQTANDTIDLIHNHSETCLHANDCIDTSVELLPAAKSHITIHSDSNTIDDFLSEDLAEFNIPEMYCSNAQDASDYNTLSTQEPDIQNSENMMSHVSDLSIFTEDLSDELPTQLEKTSKWYLLSEDETTNTNLQPLRGGLTANLNQIFPVVCSVPDLSTITEISKDTDSRKPTLEKDDS